MIYLSEKGHSRGKSLCITTIPWNFMYLGERSDKSHDVYSRVVCMTVFGAHPEAIIRGWLL